MKTIEQLQEKFSKAQKNYKTIKKNTEQKVIRWFWTTDSISNLEPFYFEENRFPKGRLHKDEPVKKENQYQYGVDDHNEIIVERQFTDLKDLFYEIFYIRGKDSIESYRFDYSIEKEIDHVELFMYEHSILTISYAVFKDGWIKYMYTYNKGKLSTKTMQRIYQNTEVPDRIFDYYYDETGLLQSIKEKEHYWYNKPNKKISYKKLTDLVSEKLLEILKQNILHYNIQEKIYCIYIYYYHEEMLPPSIGFGTESDRKEWLNEKGKEAKWIIWNPIDYSHSLEIELNEETQNLFNLYNQETSLHHKENNTIKMIIECCKNLKNSISAFELNKTDDFVVVASDYEQSDLKKNFKLINPELFYEFKNKLV
ncbi:hypothetical protein [Chryseobacterium rhizosphaerae]|uniref:DUF695 domain-containing protein n=1 Tax=Chryseobacterium rhizosphaerae TaxID=395937 RepID=A0ABX9IJR4_9FLAO|nr:hypothetical protein [Chryseobacterium rhizosphaerae]REC74681.1 hypothetical protein DRF57_13070 [Chryseobacterium rhizosphaerae]GEN66277.1 hypothetical protein CRH01_08450 [Chryseobacterium rhizosphaerae]